jgi:L-fucose isomerase
VVATENDSLNGISMLLGHLLTGTAQMFSDVRTYWSPEAVHRVTGQKVTGPGENGFLHLINSGPSPLDWTGRQSGSDGKPNVFPWWDIEPEDADACLENTLWCASDLGYFPAGGWSTDFTTRGGLPCTMFRINLVAGLGPVLQIAEGQTIELEPEVHKVLDERTSPTWPTTWFVPRLTGQGAFESAYNVMGHWGANHGAISSGHIGADLITLASMLRIPVDMQNLTDAQMYRPSAWHRFGAGMEPVGADFRACAAYGPLYG